MDLDEEVWLKAADAFHCAALDGAGWYGALEGLARLTGSRTGELIGVGSNAAVPFNIMTNMDPAFHAAFVVEGGGDPDINPRVGAGMKAPPLKVMADYDFIAPEHYKRNPHYQDFARRWDIPFICLATLEKLDGGLIGLAVCRSRKDGYITDAQRAAFTSLAPHVRAAVRTQIALEGQGALLLAGALEAMSIAALVCDRHGRVMALTPPAEKLIDGRHGLQLSLGHLRAGRADQGKALTDAIAACATGLVRPGAPVVRHVVVRGAAPASRPLALDVIALPRRHLEFTFTPRVLVVARSGRDDGPRRRTLLMAVYGLTTAEAEIAQLLAEGRSLEVIAALRGVSVGTVRFQIKTILQKTECHRQAELVARVHQL